MKRTKMRPLSGWVIVNGNGNPIDEVRYWRGQSLERLRDWHARSIAPAGARIAKVVIAESPKRPTKRGR